MVVAFLIAALALVGLQLFSLSRLVPRRGDLAVLSVVLVGPFALGALVGAVAMALLPDDVGGWALAFLLAGAVAFAGTLARNRIAARWPAARSALDDLERAVKREEAILARQSAILHPIVLEAQ